MSLWRSKKIIQQCIFLTGIYLLVFSCFSVYFSGWEGLIFYLFLFFFFNCGGQTELETLVAFHLFCRRVHTNGFIDEKFWSHSADPEGSRLPGTGRNRLFTPDKQTSPCLWTLTVLMLLTWKSGCSLTGFTEFHPHFWILFWKGVSADLFHKLHFLVAGRAAPSLKCPGGSLFGLSKRRHLPNSHDVAGLRVGGGTTSPAAV